MSTKNSAQTLATEEGLGTVTLCSCDVISLHLGAFTLRMERQAFTRLEQLITEAAKELSTRTLLPTSTPNTLGPLIH